MSHDNVHRLGAFQGSGRFAPDHGDPEGGPLDPQTGHAMTAAEEVATMANPTQPRGHVKLPANADEARAMDPADVPTFTAVAATADRFMTRLPWWLVAGGSVAATWWVLTRRK